jgi:hypothetical protein
MPSHDTNNVQSAVSHWAPRLVANGVNPTDFEEIVSNAKLETIGVRRFAI